MNEFMHWFTEDTWVFIDAVVTVITVGGVAYGLLDNNRQKKRIKICIERDNKKRELPFSLMRRNVTRAEIQGMLGSLHQGSERYDIAYTSEKSFFDAIEDIQMYKKDTLTIIINKNDKFNWVS